MEVSEDGLYWESAGILSDGSVFAWQEFALPEKHRWLRLTAVAGTPVLNEIAVVSADGNSLLALDAGKTVPGETLIDEQADVPLHLSWYDSTYFDEIYHARTAYEHLLGAEP